MSQQIFCPFCGAKNAVGARFCVSCGANLAERVPKTSMPSNQSNEENATSIPATQPTIEVSNSIPDQPTQNQSTQTTVDSTTANTSPVRYAEFGDRFVAYIIDGIIFGLITSAFTWGRGFDGYMMSSWVGTIIGIVYFWFFEAFNNGQSLGKMVMKLRTVDAITFGKINPGQALLHVIGKEIFLLIDLIIGSIGQTQDPKGKNQIRLTQKLANTSVIKIG